ncbi:MAG: SusD/RagB family nutrient-binding outer membrane lipoprotein [Saprospirales bacterium]|nr:MAG: SusD/RagB family nutrient-binding outer membrane lipoprotein [Saprospirales bacterium]
MIQFIKIILGLGLLAFIGVGCNDYLDINDDPNNPTSAPIEGLMINTTFETTRNTQRVGSTTSFFVQHFASPNASTGTDIHDAVSYGGTWSNLYFNIGDLVTLIDQAEELGAPHYSGPARIMKAYNLSLLVNMFGDVPYTDAFSSEILQPAYDDSESIYQEIQALISDGITDLSAEESAAAPGNDDFIFGGDLESWTRTAYALRARILNHYSKTGNYDPAAVLVAVENAFSNSDEDFEMSFFASPIAAQNQWYRTAVLNAGLNLGGWLSTQVVDQLNGNTFGVVDPRIEFITQPASDTSFAELVGQYIGTRNGAGRGDAPEQGVRAVLAVGSYYALSSTQPLEMITYSELKFIEAEAAIAQGNRDRAYSAYEEGIRSHMEKLGVDSEAIDAYWSQPSVSVGMANLSVNEIMKEKYIATFLNPETWNDARRFDYQYEGFQAPVNSALGGEMIRLVRYPDSELQRNQANVPDRTMLDRVFWDLP